MLLIQKQRYRRIFTRKAACPYGRPACRELAARSCFSAPLSTRPKKEKQTMKRRDFALTAAAAATLAALPAAFAQGQPFTPKEGKSECLHI